MRYRSVPSDFPSCFQNIVNGEDVFVTATGQVNHQQLLFFRVLFHHFQRVRQGVGRLQRRDDPFAAAQRFEGFQRFVIGNRNIIRATRAVQIRMLGSNGRKIQARRDRVRLFNLAFSVCIIGDFIPK
jgi:hypothetical protein